METKKIIPIIFDTDLRKNVNISGWAEPIVNTFLHRHKHTKQLPEYISIGNNSYIYLNVKPSINHCLTAKEEYKADPVYINGVGYIAMHNPLFQSELDVNRVAYSHLKGMLASGMFPLERINDFYNNKSKRKIKESNIYFTKSCSFVLPKKLKNLPVLEDYIFAKSKKSFSGDSSIVFNKDFLDKIENLEKDYRFIFVTSPELNKNTSNHLRFSIYKEAIHSLTVAMKSGEIATYGNQRYKIATDVGLISGGHFTY